MNLHRLLQARAAAGTPLRVALIGAGKFGAMYLAQAKHTPGIHIVGIADLAPGIMLMVRWFVAVPACVVERIGPSGSMKRSAELTSGHRWKVGTPRLLTTYKRRMRMSVGASS